MDFNLSAFAIRVPMEKTIHSKEYCLFLTLLRSAREQAGLTQADVAEKLGESQSFISKCERGERRIDVVELRTWCSALGVPVTDFISYFDQSCKG